MKRGAIFLFFGIFLISLVGSVSAAVENLDEIVARKARISAGQTYILSELENASNNYIWQPETLMYEDVATGHEVWKMTGDYRRNFYRDIGYSPWSADGKRMAFTSSLTSTSDPTTSNRATQAFPYSSNWPPWMIVDTDGSYFRPIPDAPARLFVHTPQFHWSPQIPDVYYEFGRNYNGEGLDSRDLYKVTVSDMGVTKELLINFPQISYELSLTKTISADGKKVVAYGDNRWAYPASVCEDGDLDIYGNELCDGAVPQLDDPDGFSSENRPWDCYWGQCPVSWMGYHDIYMSGAENNVWLYVMPEGTAGTWWRMKITGTYTDGGPDYIQDHAYPYDWGGEMEPFNTFNGNDPWCGSHEHSGEDCSQYMSHFTPDRWGRYALYGNPELGGPSVYDLENRVFSVEDYGGEGGQHHAWMGWTDYVISSSGAVGGNYINDRIYLAKYNDPNSQEIIVNVHTRYNSGGTDNSCYDSLARPAQSPDGTKASFHSSFLGVNDCMLDLYWVVAYYPYPPVITGGSKIGSDVRLTWNPPQYTDRGWPDEDLDDPPLPKEIKAYHVWESDDNVNWNELTTTGVDFKVWQYDITQAPSTTKYYAVTSEEHSRLESRRLSNVWKVTLDSAGVIIDSVEQTVYPSAPGDISSFYTTLPSAPSNVVVNQLVAGKYDLIWTEPSDSKIRYYNIYYSNVSTPPPIQQNKIASVVVGTNHYIDWLADTTSPGYYTITSVDRQGNEGVSQIDNVADVNSDGSINIIDLAIVVFNQGHDPVTETDYAHLDLTGDNNIDFNDALVVMGAM